MQSKHFLVFIILNFTMRHVCKLLRNFFCFGICYVLVNIHIIFSLLRSSVSNGRPYCFCQVSFSLLFFFSYRFCSADFLKTTRLIFMKFSHMIPYDKNLLYFFLVLMTSLPVSKNRRFCVFYRSFCPERFSKMGKERHLKFSRMIDKRLKLCKICFKCIQT